MSVPRRARRYLERLEAAPTGDHPQSQLPLAVPMDIPEEPDEVGEALDELDPDSLSPREALDALYELKKLR